MVIFDAQCLKRPIDEEAKVIMVLACSKAPGDPEKGLATSTVGMKPGYKNKTEMKLWEQGTWRSSSPGIWLTRKESVDDIGFCEK